MTDRDGTMMNAGFVAPPIGAIAALTSFDDLSHEWRRWFAEFMGTFLLVLVAAGGPMVAVDYPDSVGRAAYVVAPGLMVMAMIMFMGKVSGAHFNPCVTLAFALRRDFPWKRVPAYLLAQLLGAVSAAAVLQPLIGVSASIGGSAPGAHTSAWAAFAMEALLTFGLLSVILGTASGAQNIGIIGSIGVGSYIALAGLWASPISGASMNPFRTFGPDLIGWDLSKYWVYVAGPLVGAFVAVIAAAVLRGHGGGRSGSLAAQGILDPEIAEPEKD